MKRARLHVDPDDLAMYLDLLSILAGAVVLWWVGAVLTDWPTL
ncbi:hypothetical protein [Nocardia acidivorans]|nr:hypothetical protein [Nocardia acidivorans]